jgi:hypothetical protein
VSINKILKAAPHYPGGPLRRKETKMNKFKNETFEEWAGWKLPYIPASTGEYIFTLRIRQ